MIYLVLFVPGKLRNKLVLTNTGELVYIVLCTNQPLVTKKNSLLNHPFPIDLQPRLSNSVNFRGAKIVVSHVTVTQEL